MKRRVIPFVLSLVCILCVAVAGVVGSVSVTAEADVASPIRIVVPTGTNQYDDYAADTIAGYLKTVIGVDSIDIVTDDAEAQSNEICIGETNRQATHADFSGNTIKNGSYVITATTSYVSIEGYQGGAVRGVYRFLEEYCGCHWYSDDEVVIPELDNFSLPTDGTIEYEPYFEYAEEDWGSGDTAFSLANGLNGGSYRSLTEAQGGTVGYISGLCHTLSTQFCTVGQYFGTHPEYFAYRDGARQSSRTQLCLTNPDVLDIIKDEVLALIGPDKSRVGIVSVTQDDNYNYCLCDNCRQYAAEHGGVQSAAMINMANYVAKAVKEEGYDNILIDTFAYQYTRKAPTGLTIEDNVIVRLCTIECCFSHALDDSDCEENVDLMNDLADWSKLTNRIYVWDYTTNYARTLGYFPDFGVIQKNAQIFYEHNVRGVYEEGNYYIGACNTEFGALRRYLLARCLQNPYCDYDAEMRDFCDAYYGDAGQYVYDFIKYTSDDLEESKIHTPIYVSMANTLDLTKDEYELCEGYWTSAKAALEGQEDSKYMSRLLRSELCWRFWKSSNFRGEFSVLFSQERMDANEKLLSDIRASGASMYCESDYANIDVLPGYRFYISDDWRDGLNLFGYIGKLFTSEEGLATILTGVIVTVGVGVTMAIG